MASAVEIVFVASLSTAGLVIVLSTEELVTVLSKSETVLVTSGSTAELVTVGEEVASGSTDELETVALSGPAEEDIVSEALEVTKSSLVEDGVPWDSIFEVVKVSKSSPELVEVETGSTDDELMSGSADELEAVISG